MQIEKGKDKVAKKDEKPKKDEMEGWFDQVS